MSEPNANAESDKYHENNARSSLRSFLDNNYDLVAAMRVRSQFQDAGSKIDDTAEMKKLASFIKESQSNKLLIDAYALCQISDSTEKFSHGGSKKFVPVLDLKKSIRGFYFGITLKRQSFECVVLEPDNTRRYFDSKTPKQKKQFVQRFADRNLTQPFYTQKFVAFLTQADPEKKFNIEEMVVSARPPNSSIEDI